MELYQSYIILNKILIRYTKKRSYYLFTIIAILYFPGLLLLIIVLIYPFIEQKHFFKLNITEDKI